MHYKRIRMLKHARFAVSPEGGEPSGGGNGGGSGSSGNDGGTDGDGNEGDDGGGNGGQSFEDFLRQDGNQAEFDRRVQKAIDTAVSNAQKKWQLMTDGKVSEAEKLAKMTAAEKQQYMEQKRQRELDEREAAINRRELMATAKNTLADKGLPQELAEILVYSDAEACNRSIEQVEKAFAAAVEASVQGRLKGGDPMKKAPKMTQEEALRQEVMKAMTSGF